jgi:uncharacterized protein YkwD
MKRLAWALVLVSTGVAAAQQPATPSLTKAANAEATHDGVGAGKETQRQTKVNMVSTTTSTPRQEGIRSSNTVAIKKQAAQPVPLHQHPTMVTMLNHNNGIRGRVGLRGHRLNPALCKAAQNHAEYMASTGSFSHYTNGGYVERARRFGFRGNVLENIGYNYANTEHAFAAWQGSGAHYASIVSGTTDAGFGYARSPNGQTYWVSVYGAATAADIADAKAVFDRDKLAAEKAAAEKAAELAATETAAPIDGTQVVRTAALVDVADEKPVATEEKSSAAPAKLSPAPASPAKKSAPAPIGG